MGVLWLIIEIIFLFLYFQLPPLGDIEDKELQKSQISGQYTIQESKTITSNDYTEELPLLHNRAFINNHRKSSYNCCSLLKNKIVKFRTSVSDLLYEETVVLLTVLYFLLFAEYVLETGLVPTAEALLNWSDFETSLFFIVQSVINMTSLLTVAILSKLTRIGEIYYIIFGLVIQLGALVWLVFFFGNGQITSTDYAMYDAGFYIGLCVTVIALPFSWVTTTSLYSQVLPMRTQGFGQGVRRSTESLAAILGGLWGGAVFEVSFGYYLLYGVPTILLIMSLLFLLLSTSRIIRTTKLLQRLL
jgi:ceroid-lipofuscinosis MFS transporter 7